MNEWGSCSPAMNPDDPVGSMNDIVLSLCQVVFTSMPCKDGHCGKHVIKVKATSDFVKDGDRSNRIITAQVKGNSPLWLMHDPPDVFVSKCPVV